MVDEQACIVGASTRGRIDLVLIVQVDCRAIARWNRKFYDFLEGKIEF
jgi:hypothetical protein